MPTANSKSEEKFSRSDLVKIVEMFEAKQKELLELEQHDRAITDKLNAAHDAVVVTALSEQQAVVHRSVLPRHHDPMTIVGDHDDVVRLQVGERLRQVNRRPWTSDLG